MKKGDKTKLKILDAGLRVWPYVTPSSIAAETGLAHTAILYHFPGLSLKRAVVDHAVRKKHSRIIVQLIAIDHPAIRGMSKAERTQHYSNLEKSPD